MLTSGSPVCQRISYDWRPSLGFLHHDQLGLCTRKCTTYLRLTRPRTARSTACFDCLLGLVHRSPCNQDPSLELDYLYAQFASCIH